MWEALHRQVRDAANEQERRLREGQEPYPEKVRPLMGLKAVGVRSAWIVVTELFAWRGIHNGKELGSLVGLTPTPYDSGKTQREQGISKAGNKHVRSVIVELGWLWLRWQLGSALSQWYDARRAETAKEIELLAFAIAEKANVVGRLCAMPTRCRPMTRSRKSGRSTHRLASCAWTSSTATPWPWCTTPGPPGKVSAAESGCRQQVFAIDQF